MLNLPYKIIFDEKYFWKFSKIFQRSSKLQEFLEGTEMAERQKELDQCTQHVKLTIQNDF